jgi:hypothetical protein
MVTIRPLPPMAIELDFKALEKAAQRTFGKEDQQTITLGVQIFLTLALRQQSLTWREWERIPKSSLRWWLERPSARPQRGPKGHPELAELIRFFQHRFPGIGKYTTKDDYDDGSDSDRTVYAGRFVSFMEELSNQVRPCLPDDGISPANFGRYIKHVLTRKEKRYGRSKSVDDADLESLRNMRGKRKEVRRKDSKCFGRTGHSFDAKQSKGPVEKSRFA